MSKRIIKDSNLIKLKILEAVNILDNAVGISLGPLGLNACISSDLEDKPLVTNDGVTIAESIVLNDNVLKPLINLIIESSCSTNDKAGDGTTTATVLASALIRNFLIKLDEGMTYRRIKETLLSDRDIILEELDKLKLKINLEDPALKSVINISLDGDEELTDLVYDAIKHCDAEKDLISLRSGIENKILTSSGFQLPSVLRSSNNFKNKSKISTKHTPIIPVDARISRWEEIGQIIQVAREKSNSIIFIADDYAPDVLEKIKGINNEPGYMIQIYAYQWSVLGNSKVTLLDDIRNILNINVVNSLLLEKCLKTNVTSTSIFKQEVPDIYDNLFNHTYDCSVNRDFLLVESLDSIGGDAIVFAEEQVKEIAALLESVEVEEHQKKLLRDRLNRLNTKQSTIVLNCETPAEFDTKKLRIEDALNSAYNAVKTGVLPGGGSALLLASESIKDKNDYTSILYEAMSYPLDRILSNAFFDSDEIKEIKNNIIANKTVYNIISDEYEDFNVFTNVVDPFAVERSAILNAVSVTLTICSLGVLIVEDGEETVSTPYLSLS